MTTDTLGRSLPWDDDPEDAKTIRFNFTPPDFKIFEFIDRHGYAPSHYLLKKQRPERRSDVDTLKRLKAFCRGSKDQGTVLIAPEPQFHQFNAHARHKVYALAPYALKLLMDEGTNCAVPPTRSNWFVHDLMQACVAGSFELTATDHGFRYVPRSEVLMHELSGSARTAENPMAIKYGTKSVTLDDVFALEKDGRKRFFLMEIDRASETMNPRELPKDGSTYFSHKLKAIDELITNGGIVEWISVAKPRVLIATTTAARANQIIKQVEKFRNAGSFYITVIPEFRTNWRVPAHVLTQLLDSPWLTVNGPKDITA